MNKRAGYSRYFHWRAGFFYFPCGSLPRAAGANPQLIEAAKKKAMFLTTRR